MKKKKGFICDYCGESLKLLNKKVPFKNEYRKIIVCSRDLCLFELTFTTDEKTEKYFIDNGGIEDGS